MKRRLMARLGIEWLLLLAVFTIRGAGLLYWMFWARWRQDRR